MKRDKRTVLDPIEGIDNLPSAPDLGTPTNKNSQAKRHITPENHLSKKFVSAIGSPMTPSTGDTLSKSILGGGAGASTKYSERKNAREVALKYGDTAGEDWSDAKDWTTAVTVKHHDDKTALAGPYKFMFERLRDRAAVLDETFCRLGERLTDQYGLGEAQDTNVPHPEQHTVLGRVACDAVGRLNSNSVGRRPRQWHTAYDILDYIKEHNPHVAILNGPFVYSKHPKIEETTESFDKMFDDIYAAIASVLDEVKTHIVLVPSTRDAHHDFVYPTPPFGLYRPIHELYNPCLHSVPDPSLLNINGVSFTDILLHIGKEELAFPPRSGDRLKRLASHVTHFFLK